MEKINTFDIQNKSNKTNHFIRLLIRTTLLCCFVFQFIISTQAGTLDPSFGNGGQVTLRVRNASEYASDVIVQPDGKILAIGASDLGQSPTTGYRIDPLIVRYNSNGILDNSFGNGGIVLIELKTSSFFGLAALQSDGKIVAVGTYMSANQQQDDFLLIRFLSNGSLDTSFGNNGIVTTDFGSGRERPGAVSLQPDGKIIVAGSNLNAVFIARYNENGSLDQTFGTSGKKIVTGLGGATSPMSIVLLPKGKFILGCWTGALARFMPNGDFDIGFGINGRVFLSGISLTDILLLPDGKLLVGCMTSGYLFSGDICLMRLNPNGMLDTTYGVNGWIETDFASSRDDLYEIKLLPNGDVIATGIVGRSSVNRSMWNVAMALYNSNGQLKSKTIAKSFSDQFAYALDIQADGKFVVAGNKYPELLVLRFSEITNDSTPPRLFDFDGDSRTDLGVYKRNSGGTFWNIPFSNSIYTPYALKTQFGRDEDILAPADFDGDGKTDLGVFRPSTGTWWHTWSPGPASTNHRVFQWGMSGDVPVAADYDGDGKADYVVFRPSDGSWHIRNSSDNSYRSVQWGLSTDKPVVGDYDGDSKCDVAVWRPSNGTWYVLRSSDNQFTAYQFGLNGDKTVQWDYDGDGKTDYAVYRPSEGVWYVMNSSTGNFKAQPWGISTDIPTVGDYDGDGKGDFAVYRQSERNWYVLKSSDNTYFVYQWGDVSDLPIQGN